MLGLRAMLFELADSGAGKEGFTFSL